MAKTDLDNARFHVAHSETTPLKNLVGLADFADRTGVTYSTITAYRTRGRLPEPAAMLGRQPVWTRRQLNAYVQRAQASPRATAGTAVSAGE